MRIVDTIFGMASMSIIEINVTFIPTSGVRYKFINIVITIFIFIHKKSTFVSS